MRHAVTAMHLDENKKLLLTVGKDRLIKVSALSYFTLLSRITFFTFVVYEILISLLVVNDDAWCLVMLCCDHQCTFFTGFMGKLQFNRLYCIHVFFKKAVTAVMVT